MNASNISNAFTEEKDTIDKRYAVWMLSVPHSVVTIDHQSERKTV